jgi:hypothetical protein
MAQMQSADRVWKRLILSVDRTYDDITKPTRPTQSERTSLEMWSRGSGFGFLPGGANGYSLSDMKESSK